MILCVNIMKSKEYNDDMVEWCKTFKNSKKCKIIVNNAGTYVQNMNVNLNSKKILKGKYFIFKCLK